MTKEAKKLLTLADFEKLGINKNGTYYFDLSAIDIDNFDSLFTSIYTYGKSGPIQGLEFNINLSIESTIEYLEYKRSPVALKKHHHPKPGYESSCYKNRPKIIPELAGLISRFLPQSDTLRILKFRSLPFAFQDIDVLSQSILDNSSLQELELSGVPLADEGFFAIALSLRKKGILKLKCRNCKLTDAIGETVLSLIQYHSNIQKEAERKAELEKNPNLGIICLHSYDFRDNNLTLDFLKCIEHEVDSSPITSFDLRGNLQITDADVSSNKILVGESSVSSSFIDEESSATFSPSSNLKSSSQRHSRKEDNPIARDIVLEAENRNLRMELDQLIGGKDVAILMDDLFAVGNRARDLAEHIQRLDVFCEKLENEQMYDRTVNSDTMKASNLEDDSKPAKRKKKALHPNTPTYQSSNTQESSKTPKSTSQKQSAYPYPRKTSAYNS